MWPGPAHRHWLRGLQALDAISGPSGVGPHLRPQFTSRGRVADYLVGQRSSIRRVCGNKFTQLVTPIDGNQSLPGSGDPSARQSWAHRADIAPQTLQSSVLGCILPDCGRATPEIRSTTPCRSAAGTRQPWYLLWGPRMKSFRLACIITLLLCATASTAPAQIARRVPFAVSSRITGRRVARVTLTANTPQRRRRFRVATRGVLPPRQSPTRHLRRGRRPHGLRKSTHGTRRAREGDIQVDVVMKIGVSRKRSRSR